MPKIPTYDQLGQRVKDVSPQIGLRADPGMVNSQLAAADFYAKAQDVAYNFSMAEQKAKTETTKKELTALYNDESEEIRRNSKATTTNEFQTELETYNKKFEKNYYDRGLTKNQVTDIRGTLDLYASSKMQTGKNEAFNRGREAGSRATNVEILHNIQEIKSKAKEDPIRKKLEERNLFLYEQAIVNGETKFLDFKTPEAFKKEIKISDYRLSAETATLDNIDLVIKTIESETSLDSNVQYNLLGQAENQKKLLITEASDNFKNKVFSADPKEITKENIDKAIKALRENNSIEVTTNGKTELIDISKLDVTTKKQIANDILLRFRVEQDEKLNVAYKELQKNSTNDSLSQLKLKQKQIIKGTLFNDFNIQQRSVLQSVLTDEINNKSRIAIANSKVAIKEIEAIALSGKPFDTETLNKIEKVKNTLNLAEQEQASDNFALAVESIQGASSEFRKIMFSSYDKIEEVQNDLAKNRYTTDLGRQTYNKFNTFLNERNKRVKEDFVKYYKEENPNEVVDSASLIIKQQAMNIPDSDIRITTNRELIDFKKSFDAETNVRDRAEMGKQFLNSFGAQEGRVYRHLIASKTIDTRDQFVLAYPDSVYLETVLVANSPDVIKANTSGVYAIDPDVRKSIIDKVRNKTKEYRQTVLGGSQSEYTDAGYTEGRFGHVSSLDNMIINTAFELSKDKGNNDTGQQAAVDQAYKSVIGDHFNLDNKVNNISVRFPKKYDAVAAEYTNILQISLSNNIDYLQKVIVPPPLPFGRDPSEKASYDNKYFTELATSGTWRTTTDNNGVYLVDQTGNIVTKKIGDDEIPDDTDIAIDFITVSFDELSNFAKDYSEIPDITKTKSGNEVSTNKKQSLINIFNTKGHIF